MAALQSKQYHDICSTHSPLSFQQDETFQDGCDSHLCRVNERGEYIWEKRVTGCPPFDERKCLAEGVSSCRSDPACVSKVSLFGSVMAFCALSSPALMQSHSVQDRYLA